MSLAQRFERRLEGFVGGAFARVFKGQVEPVEIAGALQREAADKRNVMSNGDSMGRVLCPNRYRVTLAPSDHDRLVPWEAQLTTTLAEVVQEYLDDNQWETIGDIEVFLHRDDELNTGVFGIASRMEPGAPPRRRPHDSLSLPIVPGSDPGDYSQAPSHAPSNDYASAGNAGGGYAPPPAYPAPPAYAPPPAFGAPPGYGAPSPAYGEAGGNGGQAHPGYEAQSYDQQGYGRQGNDPYGPQYGQFAQPPSYAPPAPPAPMLIVDQSDRRFDLRRGSNIVGRGTESDLQLLDQGVSRRHVDVQYDGSVATAYDLGSTNGTSVNGHEISSQPLRHGDVLRVGHTRLVFHQSGSG